ncbi:glycosyl hydrolase [Anaerocolumna cellulosilytica]|uniref:Glycosyl hydrolase n=1 Tax=Anaerocolumna cellulosilytica TaxID=433286 RepID=A0A6S6R485_9FIRM|nr:glycoside hydrolase family 88 protein [Anaerocolumna cellulosilytica]MBB5193919.1 unsaturated rhamnogalacturonyl hydrolase [Anaerocolumna cellulosilytica]BCJ94867.1 glycosyl hydrolase [Anaerocolumna cellulosilytica]
MINKQQIDVLLNLVSDKMMALKNNGMEEKFPISLIDIDCWEWPQGVGIFGLYKYYKVSGKKEILEYLIEWFDERLKEGILERNVNTTAPMLTLTYLYEETNKAEYLNLIEDWVDWIMKDKKLLRTGDDCFQHMITGDPNDGEILIDTIFMTLLFLYRAGKILNRKDCQDEASYQILNHIKYLLNKEVGLFYHGFNFNRNNNYGKVMWGRGNSWYTVAVMEIIQEVELNEAIKRYFLTVYKNQVKALKLYSNKETGLWHTVIDDSDSYVEISASAAFLCGIMQGVRLGILPKSEYIDEIDKALTHIVQYIAEDGTVEQVSYGTPIGESGDFYKEIPCCPMTYGQALMILLLQEALLDYWH